MSAPIAMLIESVTLIIIIWHHMYHCVCCTSDVYTRSIAILRRKCQWDSAECTEAGYLCKSLQLLLFM